MVGLDNAGKTTILYQFLMNEVVHTSPTIGSNVEEIVWKNIHFLVWDLAGKFCPQFFNIFPLEFRSDNFERWIDNADGIHGEYFKLNVMFYRFSSFWIRSAKFTDGVEYILYEYRGK